MEPGAGGASPKQGTGFWQAGGKHWSWRQTGRSERAKGKESPKQDRVPGISSAGVMAGDENYFPSLFWAKSLPKQ